MNGRLLIVGSLLIAGLLGGTRITNAQTPVAEIIKTAVKKVVKAMDLKIQRQQNKIIWLQNAEKALENTMSKLKLGQIAEWTERQRKLYQDYFQELRQVRQTLAYYRRIHDIIETQKELVREYRHAWDLFRSEGHFAPSELDYMRQVYEGMLDESLKNLNELFLVVKSFRTQMDDADRLELIDAVAGKVHDNYIDLRSFNRENRLLGIQRAQAARDVDSERRLLDIQ